MMYVCIWWVCLFVISDTFGGRNLQIASVFNDLDQKRIIDKRKKKKKKQQQ